MQPGMGTTAVRRAPRSGPGLYSVFDKRWPSWLPSSSLSLLCSAALLAHVHSHIKWGGKCLGGTGGSLADSLETSIGNQVSERVVFSYHRLCQRLSFPRLVGLAMQSTFRLLAYKTTMQNFLLKLTIRPAIKKFISQVTCSAEPHQLL